MITISNFVTAIPAVRGTTFHLSLATKAPGSLHSVYDFLLDTYRDTEEMLRRQPPAYSVQTSCTDILLPQSRPHLGQSPPSDHMRLAKIDFSTATDLLCERPALLAVSCLEIELFHSSVANWAGMPPALPPPSPPHFDVVCLHGPPVWWVTNCLHPVVRDVCKAVSSASARSAAACTHAAADCASAAACSSMAASSATIALR